MSEPAGILEDALLDNLWLWLDRSGPLRAAELAERANEAAARLVPGIVFGKADIQKRLGEQPEHFVADASGVWRAIGDRVRSPAGGGARRFVDIRRPGVTVSPPHAWQSAALAAWSAAGHRGIIEAVTGSGKTWLGIRAIAEYLQEDGSRALIVVPTTALLDQWAAELQRLFRCAIGRVGDHGADRLTEHLIVVGVVNTAAQLWPTEVEQLAGRDDVLLVADECHRYGAEEFSKVLKAPYAATLGLSATPERDYDDGIAQHVVPGLGEVVYRYGHDAGVSDEVISDFRVLFVGLEFSEPERSEYESLTHQIGVAQKQIERLHPEFPTGKQFVRFVRQLAMLPDDDSPARRYLKLLQMRKELLTSAGQRRAFVEWLAESGALGRHRAFFFHERIDDAEATVETLNLFGVPAGSHHSQKSTEERQAMLTAFKEHKLMAIAAPKTLDEGVNVPDATLAVEVAGTKVKRQTIQRIGRVLRKKGDRVALIVKLFVRDGGDDPLTMNTGLAAKLLAEQRAAVVYWPQNREFVLAAIEHPESIESGQLTLAAAAGAAQ